MGAASGWVSAAVAAAVLAAVALDLRPWSDAVGFRARRLAAWLPTGCMYALFYCSRYAVAAAAQSAEVREELGLDLEDFALITTCGFWAYALAAPATGKLCDRLGVRRSMLFASAGCIATSLLAGLLLELGVSRAPLRLALAVLHSLGFAVQGLGTAAAVKLSSALYSREQRGVFAGVYNVLISSGYFLALGVAPSIASRLGFAWVFLLPAGALCLVVLVMLCTLRTDENLPPRQHLASAADRPVSAAGAASAARSVHQRRRQRPDADSEQTARAEQAARRARTEATVAGGQARR